MEFDWSDLLKPSIMLVVCAFAVIVVFCANALPQFASGNEKNAKFFVIVAWLIIIFVGVLGLMALFYLVKPK